ncbi:MAG: hypothetical protein Q8S33_05065 [Myxococcales bacterium]|nr:hypothetical protein [Myxococcales bacterium]MDP3499676.1 hypothetical protein [Myxococcales bacterium]
MRTLPLLLCVACATTTPFATELEEGHRQVRAMTVERSAPSAQRLEQHYCAKEMNTEQKLDCADFFDLSRNVREASSLWVQVAHDGETVEQQCFAVHRLENRAPESTERLARALLETCGQRRNERISTCTDGCSREIDECKERQRVYLASTLWNEVFPDGSRGNPPLLGQNAPAEEELMQRPDFPRCGREFSTCVSTCAMPRRTVASLER